MGCYAELHLAVTKFGDEGLFIGFTKFKGSVRKYSYLSTLEMLNVEEEHQRKWDQNWHQEEILEKGLRYKYEEIKIPKYEIYISRLVAGSMDPSVLVFSRIKRGSNKDKVFKIFEFLKGVLQMVDVVQFETS